MRNVRRFIALSIRPDAFDQLWRQRRSSPRLRSYVAAAKIADLRHLRQRRSAQVGVYQASSEGVARADGIDHLDGKSRMPECALAGSKQASMGAQSRGHQLASREILKQRIGRGLRTIRRLVLIQHRKNLRQLLIA